MLFQMHRDFSGGFDVGDCVFNNYCVDNNTYIRRLAKIEKYLRNAPTSAYECLQILAGYLEYLILNTNVPWFLVL